MMEMFYGVGAWAAKATFKSREPKKKVKRFMPSDRYSAEIKQKVEEANRAWRDYEEPKSPISLKSISLSESNHECVFEKWGEEKKDPMRDFQRSVSFSEDVEVHNY